MNQADERFKFRIWDTTRDCFYPNEHGELDWSLEETIGEESDNDFIPELMIIEQCTGLRDENGNLILREIKFCSSNSSPVGLTFRMKFRLFGINNERYLNHSIKSDLNL